MVDAETKALVSKLTGFPYIDASDLALTAVDIRRSGALVALEIASKYKNRFCGVRISRDEARRIGQSLLDCANDPDAAGYSWSHRF